MIFYPICHGFLEYTDKFDNDEQLTNNEPESTTNMSTLHLSRYYIFNSSFREKVPNKFSDDQLLADNESSSTSYVLTLHIYLDITFLGSLRRLLEPKPGVKTSIQKYFQRKNTK